MSIIEVKGGEQSAAFAVVAAMNRELRPLNRQAGSDLALIETGEGRHNAGRIIRAWLRGQNPRAILGIGFAGALSPSLQVGSLLVAIEVRGGSYKAASSPELVSAAGQVQIQGVGVHFGTVVTVDEIVVKAQAKQSLADTLPENEISCVDMESSAIAQACCERQIPFLVVRCITDALHEDLPIDFNRCRNSGGSVSPFKVLRSALLRPGSVEGLWELRRRAGECANHLGVFVKRLLPLLHERFDNEALRDG